jgi:hypothetical protein
MSAAAAISGTRAKAAGVFKSFISDLPRDDFLPSVG